MLHDAPLFINHCSCDRARFLNEAREVLERLCARGLATTNNGIYQLICEPAELRQIIDRLADLYSRHLIPVTKLVHAKPLRVRAFAAVFKLRKDR